MAENKGARVAGTISVGAAILAALAYINSKKAEAKPPGGEIVLPDEFMQLIIAIAASSDIIESDVKKIIDELTKLAIDVQGWPANANSITGLRVAITPATGIQLPSIIVPSGMALVIKAWALNPAWLFVAPSVGEAGNINQSYPLLPSETVSYFVQNADEIYISGMTPAGVPTLGCFACLTVEQRKGGGA